MKKKKKVKDDSIDKGVPFGLDTINKDLDLCKCSKNYCMIRLRYLTNVLLNIVKLYINHSPSFRQ